MSDNNEEKVIKKEVIHILNDPRDWQDAMEVKPEPNQNVVIRATNPNIVCWENDHQVYRLEDDMVAQWKEDHWEIHPPFHKYNCSPLIIDNLIKDCTIVTHWAECDDTEVTAWEHRLDYFNEYSKLYIEIDPKKEESVYRAIMCGASFIESAFHHIKDQDTADDLRECYKTLKDLQYSIDNGGIHENTIR